jgi:hypothetical protein
VLLPYESIKNDVTGININANLMKRPGGILNEITRAQRTWI